MRNSSSPKAFHSFLDFSAKKNDSMNALELIPYKEDTTYNKIKKEGYKMSNSSKGIIPNEKSSFFGYDKDSSVMSGNDTNNENNNVFSCPVTNRIGSKQYENISRSQGMHRKLSQN